MRKFLFVKEVKAGDIILRNGQTSLVKFIDIGPKMVYVKTLDGKQYSYPITDCVEVVG